MKLTFFVSTLFAILYFQSCKNSTSPKDVEKKVDSLAISHTAQEEKGSDIQAEENSAYQATPLLQTHLKDTLSMDGDFFYSFSLIQQDLQVWKMNLVFMMAIPTLVLEYPIPSLVFQKIKTSIILQPALRISDL